MTTPNRSTIEANNTTPTKKLIEQCDLLMRDEPITVQIVLTDIRNRLKQQAEEIERLKRKRVEHATKNSMMSKEIQRLQSRIAELEALNE